jgi:CheY-like chemotaxis protein
MIEPKPNSFRLLLVEDDQVLRKITVRLMNSLGHQTDSANDGVDAVHKASANRYDIIFMDLGLPGMNGIEAARRISSLPATSDRSAPPVIIALSSGRLDGDLEHLQAAGFSAAVAKPARLEALDELIKRWTGNPVSHRASFVEGTPAGEVAPSAPGTLAVNIGRLAEMAEGEPERLRELAVAFLAQITPKMEALNAALVSGNGSETLRLAHFCAGSSAACGMTALAASLRELERVARGGDLSSAIDLMKRGQDALEVTRLFLSEFLAGHQPDRERADFSS